MRTRSQTLAARKNLLDLPSEIFALLEAYLEIHELARFILTCKPIKQLMERFLYRKVSISHRLPNSNTRFFVLLLHRRPEIIHWVQKLLIGEYCVEYFPQLLAFTFPNLQNLILQHEGPVALPPFGRRKLNALHALIKPQPALRNLTLSIEEKPHASIKDYQFYALPASASTIFRHPQLVRMRLSYLDFTAFSRLPNDYFIHSQLGELFFERCRYSATILQQFIQPCQNLSKLWLYQDPYLPFPENELPVILHPVKDTLRVLKLVWSNLRPLTEDGMDFRAFPNLHSILVHPEFLFGKPYISVPKNELSVLIRSKLPPNLIILALEGVVPIGPADAGPVRPARGNTGAVQTRIGYRSIPDHDVTLMRYVLMDMESVAPKLEWLVVFYLEHLKNVPTDVEELAKEKGVRCCGLYEYDEIAPPVDMSEHVRGKEWNEREAGEQSDKGYCTVLNHSGGTVPWPHGPVANY